MTSCAAQPPSTQVPLGPTSGLLAAGPGLPAGFPRAVDSPLAWEGAQFANEEEYVLRMNEADVEEANNALRCFKELGRQGYEVSRDNFPLPNLGKRLEALRLEVHQGRGFGVVRGLNPKEYSVEDLSMLQLGLQCYIANRHGRQDRKGNMMVHIVADDSSAAAAGHHRHSTNPITFHNEEAGDIVSWMTRSTAASGGRCIIASCYTVYNVLAKDRPDLLRVLAGADWPFALPQFQCRPILFHHEGRLMMNFGRTPLIGNETHPRCESLPSLSERQLEALDAVEKIARATELAITTRPGDLHFINNLAVLHRRQGFVDGAAAAEKRHLVRMRLRDDQLGWAIPDELRNEWYQAFDEHRRSKVWHLVPMPPGYYPLRAQPN
ncbi:uncharacterized protein F5Z01DRAFT_302356 [Emericellopsis atlantica]|uniref:TauD/TfdA-like domain-containing protein n=1 Tax=Emericellopsis atlantica TaxID=2614577 RepID=A0A9P7ZU25_9HYPO|nr:uncharacterized protein F5Z01DRAFT_302356 [Emericellopsis atlantica]KAG9257812.1 hypothetical protein F5Z01DRAFT_302356 [Emericellopsis atlantica]